MALHCAPPRPPSWASRSPSPGFPSSLYHWRSWSPLQILDRSLNDGGLGFCLVVCCFRCFPPAAQRNSHIFISSAASAQLQPPAAPLNVSFGMSQVCASGSPRACPEHGFPSGPGPRWSLGGGGHGSDLLTCPPTHTHPRSGCSSLLPPGRPGRVRLVKILQGVSLVA